jgi:hypothetical protein
MALLIITLLVLNFLALIGWLILSIIDLRALKKERKDLQEIILEIRRTR